MQTFLPYPDFARSAAVLDYRRLGKQRVEARQILDALLGHNRGGWLTHPAVVMWRGYEKSLSEYGDAMIREWVNRGYKNNMLLLNSGAYMTAPLPYWFGDDRLHLSHQSNLVWKDPGFYRPKFPDVPSNLEYFWPSQEIR